VRRSDGKVHRQIIPHATGEGTPGTPRARDNSRPNIADLRGPIRRFSSTSSCRNSSHSCGFRVCCGLPVSDLAPGPPATSGRAKTEFCPDPGDPGTNAGFRGPVQISGEH
jgi:hypothetical protein